MAKDLFSLLLPPVAFRECFSTQPPTRARCELHPSSSTPSGNCFRKASAAAAPLVMSDDEGSGEPIRVENGGGRIFHFLVRAGVVCVFFSIPNAKNIHHNRFLAKFSGGH